jgi:hypothetical protein
MPDQQLVSEDFKAHIAVMNDFNKELTRPASGMDETGLARPSEAGARSRTADRR